VQTLPFGLVEMPVDIDIDFLVIESLDGDDVTRSRDDLNACRNIGQLIAGVRLCECRQRLKQQAQDCASSLVKQSRHRAKKYFLKLNILIGTIDYALFSSARSSGN
jgi:hypothetical protein